MDAQTHTTFSILSLAVYSVILEYGVHSNRSATHVITGSRKSKLFVAAVLTLAAAAPVPGHTGGGASSGACVFGRWASFSCQAWFQTGCTVLAEDTVFPCAP